MDKYDELYLERLNERLELLDRAIDLSEPSIFGTITITNDLKEKFVSLPIMGLGSDLFYAFLKEHRRLTKDKKKFLEDDQKA